jgi:hypothetical protein
MQTSSHECREAAERLIPFINEGSEPHAPVGVPGAILAMQLAFDIQPEVRHEYVCCVWDNKDIVKIVTALTQ